jgi:hypothetical protein
MSEGKVLCERCKCFHYFYDECHTPADRGIEHTGVVHRDFHRQLVEKRDYEIAALRSEVEGLREALTPSGETKGAYIGEFKFSVHAYDEDGEEKWWDEIIPWTTIKEIMAAISKRAVLARQAKVG